MSQQDGDVKRREAGAISLGKAKRGVISVATYNEAPNIGLLLHGIARATQIVKRDVQFEVWLVDDDSPDGTASVARDTAATLALPLLVLPGTRRGLGAAYLRSLERLRQVPEVGVFVTMDGDGQHLPEEIPGLIEPILTNRADVVIASRRVDGSRSPGLSRYRRCVTRLGNHLFRAVTGLRGVRDATTAFRAWRAPIAREFHAGGLLLNGYSVQTSMIAFALATAQRIEEVETVFATRVSGSSKLRPADYVEFGRNLLRIRRMLPVWAATYGKLVDDS